jgi:hypothetical protein
MDIHEHDRILHLIYQKALSDVPESILQICDRYEGAISGRIGCNFPMEFVQQHFPKHELLQKHPRAVYVIVYKKGDSLTKKHELQHAYYYMNDSFRKQVQLLWKSIHPRSQTQIETLLKKMGYPEHVWMDEFQAYYYTEPSLFGKIHIQ